MYDIKLDDIDTVVFDFDETLVSSIKAFVYANEILYGAKEIDPYSVRKWDFDDVYDDMSKTKVECIFGSQTFFDVLRPYEHMVEAMRWFKSQGKEIIILSLGTSDNLSKKAKYVKDNFYGIYDYFIYAGSDKKVSMDKSIFNFKATGRRCVMIDDSRANLKSMKNCVDHRILSTIYTQDETEWGKGWKGLSIKDGNELINIFR